MISLKRGDEVAIVPHKGSLPTEVPEIAVVAYAGPALIELADGRHFFASDGKSIREPQGCYIVRATDEHREAFRAKPR